MYGSVHVSALTWPDVDQIWRLPAPGSVFYYGGFDWLVAHCDLTNKLVILALKDLWTSWIALFNLENSRDEEERAEAFRALLVENLNGFYQTLSNRCGGNLTGLVKASTLGMDVYGDPANGDTDLIFIPPYDALLSWPVFSSSARRVALHRNESGVYTPSPWFVAEASEAAKRIQNPLRMISVIGTLLEYSIFEPRAYGIRPFIAVRLSALGLSVPDFL